MPLFVSSLTWFFVRVRLGFGCRVDFECLFFFVCCVCTCVIRRMYSRIISTILIPTRRGLRHQHIIVKQRERHTRDKLSKGDDIKRRKGAFILYSYSKYSIYCIAHCGGDKPTRATPQASDTLHKMCNTIDVFDDDDDGAFSDVDAAFISHPAPSHIRYHIFCCRCEFRIVIYHSDVSSSSSSSSLLATVVALPVLCIPGP